VSIALYTKGSGGNQLFSEQSTFSVFVLDRFEQTFQELVVRINETDCDFAMNNLFALFVHLLQTDGTVGLVEYELVTHSERIMEKITKVNYFRGLEPEKMTRIFPKYGAKYYSRSEAALVSSHQKQELFHPHPEELAFEQQFPLH